MKAIYLDNNSSTPLDPRVLAEMQIVFQEHYGNPSSSTHLYGWYAMELVNMAREKVALTCGAKPTNVIFTSGATEANNLLFKGLVEGLRATQKKLKIISSTIEHRAVLDPLASLIQQGVEIELIQVDLKGYIKFDHYEQALNEPTALVSVMLANNEIGVVQDIPKLAQIAHHRGALFHCDAAQALGKLSLNIMELGVDFLTLSAHKAYGPKGVGALVFKDLAKMELINPQILGGGQEYGLRAGTLNTPLIVGFGACAELASNEYTQINAHISTLTASFLGQLTSAFPELILNGPQTERLIGNLNLAIPGVKSSALVGKLASKVALSTTSACSSSSGELSHVLKALNLPGKIQLESFRIGIGRFNTQTEIDQAVKFIISTAHETRTE